MKLLLDTHALLWFAEGNAKLSPFARTAIEQADQTFVSAVSAMEIATKFRIGKLPEDKPLASDFPKTIARFTSSNSL